MKHIDTSMASPDPAAAVEKARQLRRDILMMVHRARSGHIGGSFSILEILVALYYRVMRIDPARPLMESRDRFVLSKGHCAPALYAVLADLGFFSSDLLRTSFRSIDGILQGHADMRKTPGVDMTTGSLGMGLSAACGMALGARIAGRDIRVYALLGDGETNEGQIWEAAACASHFGLGSLTALVDVNSLQNDGPVSEILSSGSLIDKWKAFGWNTLCVNGHDVEEIVAAIATAQKETARPSVLLCTTVKGKGVKFMENNNAYHGYKLDDGELELALKELADGG